MSEGYKFETLALHGGHVVDKDTGSRAVPIYQTTSYLFRDTGHAADLFALKEFGNIYTRIMNPTNDVFEKRLALLEGGIGALATASGQAAITLALLNLAKSGDHVVSSTDLYGGTYNLFTHTFKKLGIDVSFVNPSDPSNFKEAIRENTKAVYAESIGNPKLNALDLEAISKITRDEAVPLVIDNTVPTPYLLRPFDWKADIVVHSATKFIGGHGTSIGGVIVDSGGFDWKSSGRFTDLVEPDPSYHGLRFVETFGKLAYIVKARVQLLRDLGPALSPFNAFLFLQGLETLPLRMERHCENAQKVAEFLADHGSVEWVNYPGLPQQSTHKLAKKYFKKGFCSIVGFGIKGGKEAGKRFINNLKLVSHLANIGDAKTLAIHPASTTHQQLSREDQLKTGVTPDFVRLSIGLENVDDIISDLDQALKKSKKR